MSTPGSNGARLCRVCRHCGLCPGDGSFAPGGGLHVSTGGFIPFPLEGDESFRAEDVGIAIDLGTTTIAASAYSMKDARLLACTGEANQQARFGCDVVARIAFASTPDGARRLRAAIVAQLAKLVQRLLGEIQFQRRGRATLSRLVLAGNTAMQSLATGIPVDGLAAYPFTPAHYFGTSIPASHLFPAASPIPPDCEVFLPPVISAFIGGDAVSAMLACGFLAPPSGESAPSRSIFLADAGTNCEMAVYNASTEQVLCTSSAAGPAFEGQGIECGMAAREGAIAAVRREGRSFRCSVIGGGTAKGICGTGLLSAAASFYQAGTINANGTYPLGTDSILLQDGVYLSQKDIRAFQLAKAAVRSGLEVLADRTECNPKQAALYLAGGFGTALNAGDAATVGMIPPALAPCAIPAGNAALGGAAMQLLSSRHREQAKRIAQYAASIDLAAEPDFQNRYINALNFDG